MALIDMVKTKQNKRHAALLEKAQENDANWEQEWTKIVARIENAISLGYSDIMLKADDYRVWGEASASYWGLAARPLKVSLGLWREAIQPKLEDEGLTVTEGKVSWVADNGFTISW